MNIFAKIKWQYLVVLFAGILVGVYFTMTWYDTKAEAKVIALESRGVNYTLVSTARDISAFLTEQGLAIENARILPDETTELFSGMQIVYFAPLEIAIVDRGQARQIISSAETIREAILENDIALNPLDIVTPGLENILSAGTTIVIERIEEGEVTERENVTFETLEQGDPESLYGTETRTQTGENGVNEVTYRVRYKNGQEIERTRIGSVQITPPVPEIIRVGRKIVVEAHEEGRASWYAYRTCLCAAHPFFPKGSLLQVTNLGNGKSVIVKVNDFGPNQSIHPDRVVDLDAEAFKLLAPLGAGTISVRVEKLQSN